MWKVRHNLGENAQQPDILSENVINYNPKGKQNVGRPKRRGVWSWNSPRARRPRNA